MQRSHLLPALLVTVCLVSASACGDDDDTSDTTTLIGGTGGLPPVVVEVGEIDGTTVEVAVGGTIDITGTEVDAGWTGEVADADVATFVPPRDDGGARFDAGVEAVGEGETEVTMTDAAGTEVVFTVQVTAG